MKNILSLATLVAALCASADSDQYLYWMINPDATVGGQSLADAKASYAKVKVDGATGYLNLYAQMGDTQSLDVFASSDYFATSLALFAGTFDSSAKFFLVELYSDEGCASDTMVGAALVAYNDAYVTSGGMSHANFVNIASFYAVPEPTSGLMLLLGVAGLALRRKRVQGA